MTARTTFKHASLTERFWAKVDKSGGALNCWPWQGQTDPSGYGRFFAQSRVRRRAHRVAWEMARGAIPPGMYVCHRCDNPRCVNPDHLFLGTAVDNANDMLAKGRCKSRGPNGEANGSAKLTTAQVKVILTSKVKAKALAAEFGVHTSHIYSIRAGKNWAHLNVAAP